MDELHFSIEGEFITNVARSWFWDEDKPYEKSEELLMSCMCGGSDTEKRVTCQDICYIAITQPISSMIHLQNVL